MEPPKRSEVAEYIPPRGVGEARPGPAVGPPLVGCAQVDRPLEALGAAERIEEVLGGRQALGLLDGERGRGGWHAGDGVDPPAVRLLGRQLIACG